QTTVLLVRPDLRDLPGLGTGGRLDEGSISVREDRDRALQIGTVHPCTDSLPLLDDPWRGVPIGVPCTDGDHSNIGSSRFGPFGGRPIPAPVMGDLDDLHARDGLIVQPIPQLVQVGVAGEECAKFSVRTSSPTDELFWSRLGGGGRTRSCADPTVIVR